MNLGKNSLWKRISKTVAATTLLVSICLIPGSQTAIGKATYLGAITTLFNRPGRRFGQMAEAFITCSLGNATRRDLVSSGNLSQLSRFYSIENPTAAYAIRAIFLAVVVLFHGYLQSETRRLFNFVLRLVIVSVVS